MKEIDLINAKINRKDIPIPSFLFKYSPFEEYTFDMLEKGYVYLCPAEKLDDPSECKVDFSFNDFYDLKSNRLTLKGIDMLLEYVRPYTTKENFQRIKSVVARTLMRDGSVRRNLLLDSWTEIQELLPETYAVSLINWLGSIPEKLNDPQIRFKFIELFSLARDARRDMGICSLSELKDCDKMWNDYADNSKGYCIEYDLREYGNINLLFPVVYQDNRENNIVTSILGSFIGEMIYGMNYGQAEVDKSQFIRLFLTKDTKWSYQQEWRLLGDANQKLPAPQIHAIYLGKSISEQNKQKILDFCNTQAIIVE